MEKEKIISVLRGEEVTLNGLKLAWKAVHPDLRSSHGYRWPWRGQWAWSVTDQEYSRGGTYPHFIGDGICLAKTWSGAASGRIPAITGLICGYLPKDVLGENPDKLRVTSAFVFEVIDIPSYIRSGYLAGANMVAANLCGANLESANFRNTNLRYSNFKGANLEFANFIGANLQGSNFQNANIENAYGISNQ